MYIEPNTNIYLLTGVPLDNKYENTIYFDNRNEQTAYFTNKAKYTFTHQSYTRVKRGYLKIAINAENIFDCNYMMFQNASFGTGKWFYAFIKNVEYINNDTAQIEFELDVMQTWHFNYTLRNSFVDREHSVADTYFYQAVAENLDLGDSYICEQSQQLDLSNMSVGLLVSQYSDQSLKTVGAVYNGVFCRLGFKFGEGTQKYDLNNSEAVASLNAEIDKYVEKGKTDAILQMFQYPSRILTESGGAVVPYTSNFNCTLSKVQTVDNYTPRNLKLLNYPYKFLRFSNNMGTQNDLKYENFKTQDINFYLQGVVISRPSVALSPKEYAGQDINYDEGIAINNFPVCGFTNDTYKEWINNNQNAVATSTITSALTGVGAGLLTANPIVGVGTAVASSAVGVANLVARQQDIRNQPPGAKGQLQADCLLTGTKRFGYSFYRMSIKSQIARVIDDYFDKYGYACHRVKTPNRKVREHWTYTKTIGCNIVGRLPADDISKICDIYDKGITFWVNGAVVGDYSQSNKPL